MRLMELVLAPSGPVDAEGYHLNKHGVQVKYTGLGRFISYDVKTGEKSDKQYDEIPKCCFDCTHLDRECGDYGEPLTPYYCGANIPKFPTRKGACKKQNKWRG